MVHPVEYSGDCLREYLQGQLVPSSDFLEIQKGRLLSPGPTRRPKQKGKSAKRVPLLVVRESDEPLLHLEMCCFSRPLLLDCECQFSCHPPCVANPQFNVHFTFSISPGIQPLLKAGSVGPYQLPSFPSLRAACLCAFGIADHF